ncbi:MAG: YihY/virulence factor BrkB family protein, partial [Fusobacteriaceae bacterium]|nr:YihY/virulence factor BrkB family protein [Fusobacteriaceae bacterium]
FTMCLLFSIIYVIIPNTKVKFRYALISGIFSTILTIISQKIFFSTQKFLLNYSLVYGSFAILPIFLLWQRFFWSIILLGCHLNFISQNYYKYDYSLNPIKLSFHEKKIISLMIMYILIKNFEDNECEITTEYVAKKLEISINLTQNLIDNLIKIGLINKISVDNKPFFYKPSTSIEKMDIDFITKKLEFFGINNLLDLEENKLKIIYENLNNLIIHNKNTKLKDL